MLTEAPMTVRDVLESRAQMYPEHLALLTPDRRPLTYRALNAHTRRIAAQLQRAGVRRGDRIGVVLPDSAEVPVAVYSVANVATAVLLKPTLPAEEYRDMFSRMQVKAVILEEATPRAAHDVANALHLPIWKLYPRWQEMAGLFDLDAPEGDAPADAEFARLDDMAWPAFTSGTTARPKLVPMTHKMIWYRIGPDAVQLDRNAADRGLILNPIGQNSTMVGVLRTLGWGGSTILARNFDVAQFIDYLDAFQPTWCTGSATLYQTILVNAAFRGRVLRGTSLRFLRSGAMALSPQLLIELQDTFQIPILQAYGSTETGPIAANPLPPATNKPGSAGIIAGAEARIVDETGRPVPIGVAGEIVARGNGVMSGYYDDAEANSRVFFGEWYRTGDMGYLDEDGYLFITGRIKDQINRGGEMISPPQIENVLLAHPVIVQAVVFPIADARLGEEVGAAVVLRNGETVTERELRAFAADRLGPTKVPRRIVVVDDIPRSDTGKIKRASLAEKFGLTAVSPYDAQYSGGGQSYVAPRTSLEVSIAALWAEVLGKQGIGIYDEFLDMGGDSLAATRLISRLRLRLQIEITLLEFFDAPTIARQAEIVEKLL